ncbi:MAG: sulfotransferase [Gammaproteobacteria bacterium]|nr:sulfotransferase [Gammaproteobacteria bacterium]
MYFDVQYYWRVLRHVWSLNDWPGRRQTLFKLLILVPLGYVINAACFVLDYLLFPSLWRQSVRQPVFIVGHARSGTTLCHRLLAADGDTFSYFLYWEMFFPSLLQKKLMGALGVLDKKLLGGFCNRKLVAWDDRTFGRYRHIHNMSLWNSEEDQFVMRGAFVTQQWSLDIPMMHKLDIFHVDQMPLQKRRRWLRHYKECVKRQLVFNGGDKIHLAKNPLMSGWVQSLIDTFPDARIIVMLRNPLECIPSVLKLVEVTWQGKGWSRDQYALSLKLLTDVSFESFTHPRDVLKANPATAQVAVDYRDITAQPRNTVHAIYAAIGLQVSPEFDDYLRAQEDRERGHTTHFRYSIDEFDVTAERIESELADFFAAYGWPSQSEVATGIEENV